MIPDAWRRGEIAVLGLSRTGLAVAKFLCTQGFSVYASDATESHRTTDAANSLRALGVSIDVGRHDLSRIAQAALVVPSPGIPPSAQPLKAALDAGCTVIAELDLALLFLARIPSVVVSGTNGKSTTTALIAHLLNASGVKAVAAGNIGNPLIEVAAADTQPDWVVVEASSYQLHFAPNLTPNIGVLTNVSPEHLEWHGSVEAYYADKAKLFLNASAESMWVLNGDDKVVQDLAAGVTGSLKLWSLQQRANAWYDVTGQRLMLEDTLLIPRSDFVLLGDHNASNALAATLAAACAGAKPETITAGLGSFRSLSHRLEPIREVDGILWINDSKATNVPSTAVALAAMNRPYVLLMGGLGKGAPYSTLVSDLEDGCRGVVAFGEDRERIVEELSTSVPVYVEVDIVAAVSHASSLAEVGDVVLLSPACASFDQFRDYEHRGDVFRELVEAF